MSDFRVVIGGKSSYRKRIEKYFNKLFGIQKTLGNLAERTKNQFSAVKATAGMLKAAASGRENLAEKAKEAEAALDRSAYGDRSAWIEKAQAALASV